MQELRISIVQTNIVWENKQENLRLLRDKLQTLHGTTEIVVLPEMFSTGFSMNSRKLAEPISGETIQTLKKWPENFSSLLPEASFAANKVRIITALSLSPPKEKSITTTNATSSAWGKKLNIFPLETVNSLSPTANGTSACWYATICVSRYGAGM